MRKTKSFKVESLSKLSGSIGGYVTFSHNEQVKIHKFFREQPRDIKNIKLVFEYETPILDEIEKKYLTNVLRPFKDKINFIYKSKTGLGYYIMVDFDTFSFDFPYFEENTMYQGMELDVAYTLEELGLFQK
jgi:hypothetical protein